MRNSFMVTAALLVGTMIGYLGVVGNASAQAKKRVTVPAGTRILIRTIDPIDSSKQKTGYRFKASLETDLQLEDTAVAPRGTIVYGRLAQASSAGRMSGSSELTLEMTDIVINGASYPLFTSTYEIKGKGEGKKTARKVLGGAGLGAIIGGIAGGGSGAAIGVLAGAAGGTALAASKKGEQLQIPSESLLEFRIEQPVSLPVRDSQKQVRPATGTEPLRTQTFLLTLLLSRHWKIDGFTIQAGNGLHVGSIGRYPCLPANITYRLPRVADPNPIRGAGIRGITRSCTLPSSATMCVLA